MSKLLKNSAIYTFVGILQKASGFFLLPLYTHYLSKSEYGTFALVQAMIVLLATLFTFQLRGAITRYTVKFQDSEPEKLRRLLGSCLYFTVSSSVILSLVTCFIYPQLLQSQFENIPLYPIILLGLISTITNPLFQIYQSILQASHNAKSYGKNNFLFSISNILLNVILLTRFGLKAEGLLLSLAITNIIFSLHAYYKLFSQIDHGIYIDELKIALKYSMPLIPHGVLSWVTTMSDRLMLAKLASTAITGIYAISFQLTSPLQILAQSVHQAYSPWFYQKYEEGEQGKKEINRAAFLISFTYGFIAFFLTLFAKEIVYLLASEDYKDSWKAIFGIAFGFAFNGVYFTYCNILFHEKTSKVSWVTLLSGSSNILLNFLLIPHIGIIGVSFAVLISRFLLCLATIYFSRQLKEFQIKYVKITAIPFVFFPIAACVFFMEYNELNLFWIYKTIIALITAFIFALFLRKQILSIFNLLKKRF